ncbi:hypothetical protein [Sphingobacterium sp. HMA12]|uniref:hypothetical protein n=1 Tax=Sphingobacterium sp. HMA12 TaxID=2050894 RepID=UPI0018F80991|nr:hypothetical protein [Sphingobacterium sp. HMA12]
MNKRVVFVTIFLGLSTCCHTQVQHPRNKANQAQKKIINSGYGMFMHFGVNTFTGMKWSDGSIPASKYNPILHS